VHVHCFLDYVSSTFTRLDIIIHNAAQTIRRPPQYYKPLTAKELALDRSQAIPSPREAQLVLAHHAAFQSKICTSTERWRSRSLQPQTEPSPVGNAVSHNHRIVHPVTMSSALKSQIPVLASDLTLDLKAFPPGMVDVNGQQLDLRSTNSWIAQLGEVETPELAEVFTINAMAPFVMNNRLLPMLGRDGNANEPKFIINVSAMEGKFNRPKRANHPHTNSTFRIWFILLLSREGD
jgi:NAD(P)-dependent dehydrogenase (short-subunit alcohol dehydrogenase family)